MYEVGVLFVEPVIDLKNTSMILGRILHADFMRDDDDTFDEFPAYIGSSNAHHYALLGIPEEEKSDNEEDHIYQLEIWDVDETRIEKGNIDVSSIIAERIRKTGRIKCWTSEEMERSDI